MTSIHTSRRARMAMAAGGCLAVSAASPTGALRAVAATGEQPAISEFLLADSMKGMTSGSQYIIRGPDGAMWLTAEETGAVGRVVRVAMNGSNRSFTPLDPTSTPLDPGGAYSPTGITAGADGDIWYVESPGIENNSPTYIGRMAPDGTGTTAFVFAGGPPDSGRSLVLGPDGHLWINKPTVGALANLTSGPTVPGSFQTGTETDVSVSSTGEMSDLGLGCPGPGEYDGPGDLVVGSDQSIWFPAGSAVGRVTKAGTVDTYTLPSGDHVRAVAQGPDGAVWFWAVHIEAGAAPVGGTPLDGNCTVDGRIEGSSGFGYVSPTGKVTENVIRTTAHMDVAAMTADQDGTIWFTDKGSDAIGEFRSCSTLQPVELRLPEGTGDGVFGSIHSPWGIAVGPDGNIWFTEAVTPYVGRVNVSAAGMLPPCRSSARVAHALEARSSPMPSGVTKVRWNPVQ